MQVKFENPALSLRAAIAPRHPRGMLRWDASGVSLLVSDAPRRAGGDVLLALVRAQGFSSFLRDGLLYVDLPTADYEALASYDFLAPGNWREDWFAEQALLAGILARPRGDAPAFPDVPLLRAALLACAQGGPSVRRFLSALRTRDAQALRAGDARTCRACAALCAHWLWTCEGLGVPLLFATTAAEKGEGWS